MIDAAADPTILAALTLGAVRSAIGTQMSANNFIQADELTETIWQYVRQGLGLE